MNDRLTPLTGFRPLNGLEKKALRTKLGRNDDLSPIWFQPFNDFYVGYARQGDFTICTVLVRTTVPLYMTIEDTFRDGGVVRVPDEDKTHVTLFQGATKRHPDEDHRELYARMTALTRAIESVGIRLNPEVEQHAARHLRNELHRVADPSTPVPLECGVQNPCLEIELESKPYHSWYPDYPSRRSGRS